MTLESTASQTKYVGNGVATEFAFNFKIWKKDQILVYVGDNLGERNVTSTCAVDITETGGTVTFPAPPAEGVTIVIKRNMPYVQEDNYINGDRFNSEEVEDRFDQDCAERQDLKRELERCVKILNTSSMSAEEFVQALLEALDAMRQAGDVTGSSLVKASNGTVYRTLSNYFGDLLSIKNFGAKGDGEWDDSDAWGAWQAALENGGMGYVPAGVYIVDGVRMEFKHGAIGNFRAGEFDVSRWTQTVDGDVAVNLGRKWDVEDASDIAPSIVVENEVDTTDTTESDNCAVCAYLAHTQTGENASNTVFSTSLITTAVSNAQGDNDVIACSNRALRYDKPGCVGDCAGVGGRIDVSAHQKGCSMGAEFAVHITDDIGVPCPSDFSNASTSKWVTPVHITGDTAGSPATAAILIQGSRTSVPYWDGIQFSYTMFPTVASKADTTFLKNEIPNNDGSPSSTYPGVDGGYDETGHVPDTVAINMGSFSQNNGYPDTCIKMGYAKQHVWTPGQVFTVRANGIEARAESNISYYATAKKTSNNIYGNTSYGFREQDGENTPVLNAHILFNSETRSVSIHNYALDYGVTWFKNRYNNGNYLTGTIDSSGTIDPADPYSFYAPGLTAGGTRSKMSLGHPNRQWENVYAITSTFGDSDERLKQDIEPIPEAVLRAWGRVKFRQFRFKAAVAEKGEGARLHCGVIAQRIAEAFEAEGVDAFAYGIIGHDVQPAQEEVWTEYDVEHPAEFDEDGTVLREAYAERVRELSVQASPAADTYRVRYEECLVLECAYQRWRLEQIEERINQLTSNS